MGKMKHLSSRLQDTFQQALSKAFPGVDFPVEITQATQAKFGHYQCNTPMKLAKLVGIPPRAIAEKLIQEIKTGQEFIEKLEIAGPGFINITLSSAFLSKSVAKLFENPDLKEFSAHSHTRVLIDFSSPNVAKEMHVGHLRSTIVGDCLARVFEFLGYDVIRRNHIGDWGTAFGMLIAYMKERHSDVLSGKTKTDLSSLVQWYRESKKLFDEDADFKKRAQLEVVHLQGGDQEALKAWEIICGISRNAYQEIYDLLEIKIEEKGESFYNPYLKKTVEDLERKRLLEVSEGAKCVFLDGFKNREGEPLPLILQKSDGGYNYASTDMAAIQYRINEEKADRIIYVTDAGQATHFAMVFEAAKKAGYLDSNKVRVDHVPFGLVLGPDGKKFKTRSGETERLIDLLSVAVEKAFAILQERGTSLSSEEKKEAAEAIGIGAIKYADLSNHRLSDYSFSYDKMLRFEGNTAAFLLYAAVRIEGIKRKVNLSLEETLKTTSICLVHPSEVALGLHLLQFEETLENIVEELLPNRLTDYLYTLSEKFNLFFRDCRVEGSDQEKERYLLCEATAKILKQGLVLLGLKPVSRM